MIVIVVQLGFHTCRGSASCGGLRFAFSFSFVTQASCGHRERGRTVRGLNGVGRGQGGRSHAQRACCEVAIFCWNQSGLSRKRGVSDGSESGSDAEPSGWVCTFICTWWESICRSKLARPRETPAEVGTVSREAGLAAVDSTSSTTAVRGVHVQLRHGLFRRRFRLKTVSPLSTCCRQLQVELM